MSAKDYEAFNESINFTDPVHIAQAIAHGADHPSGYGFLNMGRDAEIFDIGSGPGILGKLLHAEGFSKIDGADCASNFVEAA